MRVIIGIDNGPSGTVGILGNSIGPFFEEMPTFDQLHYGRKGTKTKRLDRSTLKDWLTFLPENSHAFIERPFTGQFIKTALSARAFYEATLTVLEDLEIGYTTIDSKEWQKPMLGEVKGSPQLKKASRLRGIEMYPQFKDQIEKHKDADGLLIAHRYYYL